MNGSLQRIRIGTTVLVSIVVVATLGYRFGAGYTWVNSLWMVVITISTVGYSEPSALGPGMQLFTVCVILIGIFAASYTFSGLLQLMVEGEIQQAFGNRKMTKELDRFNDHIIVCGYGRIGRHLAEGLAENGTPLVVIDESAASVAKAREDGFLCLQGDATEEATLLAAGVERANCLMSSLPSDAANVFITLTVRNLNTEVSIICRAENASTEAKLRQAGADRVVLPTIVSARQIVRMITRPSTADLMELVAERKFQDVELDELDVVANSPLVGVSVGQTEAHRRHRLLVVAVKQSDRSMVFNPDSDHCFAAGDILIMMGHTQDIVSFREFYQVED